MKREGRQHGMVRTCLSLNSKSINRFDCHLTAGLFAKVSSKPTNHSKFTGRCKCSCCHGRPSIKSKDKKRGNQKQISSLVLRMMDSRPGLRFAGASATAILDHLSTVYYTDYYDYDVDDDDAVTSGLIEDDSISIDENPPCSSEINFAQSIGVDDHNDDSNNVYYDEDWMRFCEIGFFVVDQADGDGDGDDDWCLVEEMQ